MLSELIDEIEERLRLIVREEVRNALIELRYLPEHSQNKVEEIPKSSKATKDFPTILKAEEVAEMLELTKQRIYELTRERKRNGLPVIVVGDRQYRYSKEAILEWVNRKDQ